MICTDKYVAIRRTPCYNTIMLDRALTFRLPPDVARCFEETCWRRGVSMSEALRQLASAYAAGEEGLADWIYERVKEILRSEEECGCGGQGRHDEPGPNPEVL